VEVTAEAVEAVEAEAAESEDEDEEAAAATPGPRFEDDPEAQIAMLQVKVTVHHPTVRTFRSQTDDGSETEARPLELAGRRLPFRLEVAAVATPRCVEGD